MDYDAILFDLDGVLVQGRATDPAVYEQAARETIEAFDLENDGGLRERLADPHSLDPVREALASRDVDAEAVWRYREERASDIENEHIRDAGRARYPGVDVLEELAADAALGVVSNNRMGTVAFVCEYFGFDDVVSTWYGRHPTFDGHSRMKPDPYYLHRALEDLGMASDGDTVDVELCESDAAGSGRALYVGDRESDLEAARRAGLEAAFLRRSHNREVTPETRPDHVLESLEDLLGSG